MSTELANRSFMYVIIPVSTSVITSADVLLTEQDPFAYVNTLARYTPQEFYGVMIDTGASRRSTAGYGQYLAYKKISNIDIDIAQAGAINVQFGIGSTPSIGLITVNTPIGNVDFHVVKADTPFLLCLKDMDTLRTYYNNVTDMLITLSAKLLVTRRFGYPFLL